MARQQTVSLQDSVKKVTVAAATQNLKRVTEAAIEVDALVSLRYNEVNYLCRRKEKLVFIQANEVRLIEINCIDFLVSTDEPG